MSASRTRIPVSMSRITARPTALALVLVALLVLGAASLLLDGAAADGSRQDHRSGGAPIGAGDGSVPDIVEPARSVDVARAAAEAAAAPPSDPLAAAAPGTRAINELTGRVVDERT